MSTTNQQVAHVWAQGKGLTKNGSNFSCTGNNLFSYATLIGFIKFTDKKNTHPVAFLSSNKMSQTTSNHLSYARRAFPWLIVDSPVFQYGKSYRPTVREALIASAKALISQYAGFALKRSNLTYALDAYRAERAHLFDIAKRFRVKLPAIPVVSPELTERAKRFRIAAEQKEQKAREERERLMAIQRELDKNQFNAWLLTGEGSFPHSYRHAYGYGSDYLTVKGETVVTSQGAEAPLSHVAKAVRFYLSRKHGESFEPYQTNGHSIPLGHFVLESIDEKGTVKAGCHTFGRDEIERFINHWHLWHLN